MKKAVRAVYVIDESGSMLSNRSQTVSGLQQDFINLKEEEAKFGNIEYYVTVVTFNENMKIHVDNVKLSELDFTFDSVYRPSGGTALNQTVGNVLEKISPSESNVLITVMTDGQENASIGEYADSSVLKSLIKECEEVRKWAFVFLGADKNAWSQSGTIGISNSISYDTSNIIGAYNAIRGARVSYTCNLSDTGGSNNANLMRNVSSSTVESLDKLIENTKI